MALKELQNFYKAVIIDGIESGTGVCYVSALPTPTRGYVVINPSNVTKREIVEYDGVGTDDGGDYLTMITRGVGGTTDQAHDINEPVRMNITAEHYAEVQDEFDDFQEQIDTLVLQNAPNASASVKGIVKLNIAPDDSNEPIAFGANSISVETTTGTTHSLTTTAGQKVIVWAKGFVSGGGGAITTELKYDGTTKDSNAWVSGKDTMGPFCLMYTETPSAGTRNITVTNSAGSLDSVVIIVMKIG